MIIIIRAKRPTHLCAIVAAFLLVACTLWAQDAPPAGTLPKQTTPAYTPKYHGDPARSDSEFAALAYMRVVMRAQMLFNKHYGHYATSLSQLVHTGTFTQRMVNPERGDYTGAFLKGKKEGFVLTMTPKISTPSTALFMPRRMARSTPTKARPPTGIRKWWRLTAGNRVRRDKIQHG